MDDKNNNENKKYLAAPSKCKSQPLPGDVQMLHYFEQINTTLSNHIDYLQEYRLIFSEYESQIVKNTTEKTQTTLERISLLVHNTIHQDVTKAISNMWKSRFAIASDKCFSSLLSSLSQTFQSLNNISSDVDHFPILNIQNIINTFSTELSSFTSTSLSKHVDISTLQQSINDHFTKHITMHQQIVSSSHKRNNSTHSFDQSTRTENDSSFDQLNNNNNNNNNNRMNDDNDENNNDVHLTKNDTQKANKKNKQNEINNQSGILNKIKSIFKKDENQPSHVNLEGVSNDFRFCPIKKAWIFDGQEENTVLDQPPPIGQIDDQNKDLINKQSKQSEQSSLETPLDDIKNSLTRPVSYRNARDVKQKAKESLKSKSKQSAMQFNQSNDTPAHSNNQDIPQSEQLFHNHDSHSQQQVDQYNQQSMNNVLSDIIDKLNYEIRGVIDEQAQNNECVSAVLRRVDDIEDSLKERRKEEGLIICGLVEQQVATIQKENNHCSSRMLRFYENDVQLLTRDYMDLLDDRMSKVKDGQSNGKELKEETDGMNSTVDSSVVEFYTNQSMRIKELQTELMKKQCLMGRQDNKNIGIIKNMVDRISRLDSQIVHFTGVEMSNDNLHTINQQLQALLKDQKDQAVKVLNIKDKSLLSINQVNRQLVGSIHFKQQLIDTLHTEITQKNRAIHELQVKNINLENISYQKEEKITDLQSAISQKTADIKSSLKKESLLNEDIFKLHTTLASIQEELALYKQELSQHVNDITHLQEKNENFEQIEQNMNEELVSIQIDYDNYRDQTEKQISHLESIIDEKAAEKEGLQREIQRMLTKQEHIQSFYSNQMSNLQGHLINVFEGDDILSQLKKGEEGLGEEEIITLSIERIKEIISIKMTQMTEEKKTMVEKMSDQNYDIENERTYIDQLQAELDVLVEQIQQFTADKERVLLEKQLLKEESAQEITKLNEEIMQKDDILQEKIKEISQLIAITEDQEQQITDLTRTSHEHVKEVDQIKQMTREKEDDLTLKSAIIIDLKETLDNYEKQISHCTSEITQKDIEINDLSNQTQHFSVEIADLQQTKQDTISYYEDKIDSMKKHIEEMTLTIQNKDERIETVERCVQDLTDKTRYLDQIQCDQSEEIQNYKTLEEHNSTNLVQEKEEYEKREKDLKEKLDKLSKEIEELNRQNDDQTNEFANKIITLESLNSDLNDQMEQIRSDKEKSIQFIKDKYVQLENEYRGQIEDFQSQMKWEKQINDDSYRLSCTPSNVDLHSHPNHIDNNISSSEKVSEHYKETIDLLELTVIQLKNELSTSNNTNLVIQKQIKTLSSSNSLLTSELAETVAQLHNLKHVHSILQQETDEATTSFAVKSLSQFHSNTSPLRINKQQNEKKHLKMCVDEVLERMNDSESIEKYNSLKLQCDALIAEKDTWQMNNRNSTTHHSLQEIDLADTTKTSDVTHQPVPNEEGHLFKQNQEHVDVSKENKKTKGFLNALAGIFLTEKDRKMLDNN